MAGENFRYISEAARIADRLEPHLSSDAKRPAGGVRGPKPTGSRAPIRIDVASALDEHDRDVLQDLVIRKTARENLDGTAPDVRFPDRRAGAKRLIEMLDDGQDPEPLTARTVATMRRHFTILTCVLADAEGQIRMRCPRNHAPAEDLPTRTVVPAALLNIPTGLVVCMHPECDEALGVPRMLNLVEEMLTNDPDSLLGIEEVAFLLGISEDAAKARIRRAREKGHDLPVVDFRTSAKGQQQALHRLADLIKANNIARDLGVGIANWPKQCRRRGCPNPSI